MLTPLSEFQKGLAAAQIGTHLRRCAVLDRTASDEDKAAYLGDNLNSSICCLSACLCRCYAAFAITLRISAFFRPSRIRPSDFRTRPALVKPSQGSARVPAIAPSLPLQSANFWLLQS